MDVSYDDSTINNDFTRRDVFLRADYRPSRSQYVVDLGSTRIDPDRGEDLDGTLARLSWIRQLTSESSFGLSASSEYSDTGTDILTTASTVSTTTTSAAGLPVAPESPDTAGDGLSSNAITSDVYYDKRGEMFYTRRGSSFGADVNASARDLDFETTPQDRREVYWRLELDYFYSGASRCAGPGRAHPGT